MPTKDGFFYTVLRLEGLFGHEPPPKPTHEFETKPPPPFHRKINYYHPIQ